jgi:hypothetical protein
MKLISRRTVLRGAGGVLVPLPLLDVMARPKPARADGALSKTGYGGAPKRFFVFFTGAGQGADWLKSSNDASGKLVLPPALKPLDAYKDQILILDGIANQSALHDGAGIDPGHQKPMVNLMTCVSSQGGLGGGISIDQAIAKQISMGTKVPSIHLASQPQSGYAINLAYTGSQTALPTIGEMKQAFAKLFSDAQTAPNALASIVADRKSILDGLQRDYGSLITKMSGEDKDRLQAHLDAIRDVESRLGAADATSSCTAPAAPGDNPRGQPAIQPIGEAMLTMIAIAFKCDITRVGSFTYQGSGSDVQPPGFPMGCHSASHVYGPGGWPLRNQFTSWFASRLAFFLDQLKSAKEGDKSVLDNTVIYWCSEHGCGNHNYDWMPVMVVGSGGGYFKTGRNIRYPNNTDGVGFVSAGASVSGPSQADLYVSFLNAMGIQSQSFGNPSQCRGPLPGLTG